MVSRADVAAVRRAADQRRSARAAMPDTSGLGVLTSRTSTVKTYRNEQPDGTVTGTMVMRGGTALSVVGVCLGCIVGVTECCTPVPEQPDDPPADEQPQPVPAAPRPPVAPTAAAAPDPAPERPDPLASIRADRWSKSL
ncbi:hypothetical protein [Streptomyces sp. NBC_01314]|uniref:hypothetical protein n=1 Tax=Streptomyces sp. NBC_01314 TaxID=2903821 RepID=UPI003085392D|nr:hypothetical protein OG622_10865 [Streptomyces sp. NBC_01314]